MGSIVTVTFLDLLHKINKLTIEKFETKAQRDMMAKTDFQKCPSLRWTRAFKPGIELVGFKPIFAGLDPPLDPEPLTVVANEGKFLEPCKNLARRGCKWDHQVAPTR